MTLQELLDEKHIQLEDYKPGQHSTTCPECSHARSRAHQKTECLSVLIDQKGATWNCHHCGWKGGQTPMRNQTGLEAARKEMKHAWRYRAEGGSHRSVKPRGDLLDDVAPAQVREEVEQRCGAQPITFGCGRAGNPA